MRLAVPLLLLLLPVSPAAASEPLLFETFDDDAALARWERTVGAYTGDAPESSAAIDGGALRLRGDAGTQRWLALERQVPAGGARFLLLSARMKTADGPPRERPLQELLRLRARRREGPPPRRARARGDERLDARGAPLPRPGGYARRGGRLLPLHAGDGLIRRRPPRARARDRALRLRTPPRRRDPRAGAPLQRGVLRDAPRLLRARPRGADRLLQVPGRGGEEGLHGPRRQPARGRRDARDHSLWASDRHEVVHLFAPAWGDPPALLGEGIAVHLSGAWQRRPVAAAAHGVLDAGKWTPLAEILDTAAFRTRPDEATYPVAGALVEWLLASQGKEKLRAAYGALKNGATLDANRAAFEAAFGFSIEEADRRLREHLGGS